MRCVAPGFFAYNGGMTLPTAVATGAGAEPRDAGIASVRPSRIGLGAGVLAAVYIGALFCVKPLPGKLVGLLGGAPDGVERYGGLRMTWHPPAGLDLDALTTRFADRDVRAVLRPDPDGVIVEVPHVKRADVAEVARMVGGAGKVEFREVIIADEMRELPKLVPTLSDKCCVGVTLEDDQWSDENDHGHTDYYLRAPTRAMIERAIGEARSHGWALPPHTHFGFEYVPQWHGEVTTTAFWRTYVLADALEVDGDAVISAITSFDPNTNRPIVLLEFDREGGRAFGELTARIVGKKLATVVGDEVRSAPVINSAIRGGRASIMMGSRDPDKEQHDADVLAVTLRAGALPPGGRIVKSQYVAPADDGVMTWIARLILALGGGALLGLVAWFAVRATRPIRRVRSPAAVGAFPATRLFVTLTAPFVIVIASYIPLPGVDADVLRDLVGPHGPRLVNVGMLGLAPLITAYLLVEFIALIVPSWRRRRHAGPDARKPLSHAVVGVTLALVVIQAWYIASYLQSIDDALSFGLAPRLFVIGAIGAATLAFAGIAAAIRTHGLGNGYGALLTGGWLVAFGRHWADAPMSAADLLAIVTLVAIAIIVATVLRWRIYSAGESSLRVPTSGIAPLSDAGGMVVVIGLLGMFQADAVAARLGRWTADVHQRTWLVIALVIALAFVWSAAFARPAVTRDFAQRVGLAAPSWQSWRRATALSATALVLIGGVAIATSGARGSIAWLVEPVAACIATAVVLDIIDDLRARRVELDRVWIVHQPQHAELIARALGDAGIPCHLAASHLRTLLAWFGPFAPIDVLVPTEFVPSATTKLRELFG